MNNLVPSCTHRNACSLWGEPWRELCIDFLQQETIDQQQLFTGCGTKIDADRTPGHAQRCGHQGAECRVCFSLLGRSLNLHFQRLPKPTNNLASGSTRNSLDFNTATGHGWIGTCASQAKATSSFACSPSKAPLLRTTRTSPFCNWGRSFSMILSAEGS